MRPSPIRNPSSSSQHCNRRCRRSAPVAAKSRWHVCWMLSHWALRKVNLLDCCTKPSSLPRQSAILNPDLPGSLRSSRSAVHPCQPNTSRFHPRLRVSRSTTCWPPANCCPWAPVSSPASRPSRVISMATECRSLPKTANRHTVTRSTQRSNWFSRRQNPSPTRRWCTCWLLRWTSMTSGPLPASRYRPLMRAMPMCKSQGPAAWPWLSVWAAS